MALRINTDNFGELEVTEEQILHMNGGMLGFEPHKRFALLEDGTGGPFGWLQSVDNPSLAFLVVNPIDFFGDYDLEISDEDAESLGLTNPTDVKLMTTVTVDDRGGLITTNLLGPIVINSRTLQAKQVVLQDERYGTKHLIGKSAADRKAA
ncbi:MAG: flagellar assembly protein FliW [Armatimonadota bacterium]